MRKFLMALFFAPLVLLASCMHVGGSGGSDGAVRVAVPGSGARSAYMLDKNDTSTYRVFLLSGTEILDTKESSPGGRTLYLKILLPVNIQ